MVRLKCRYILFEILYPPMELNESYDELGLNSSNDILLAHHRTSSPVITNKTIMQELHRILQINFGDFGVGRAKYLLNMKYFSNKTSTGILRCSRDDYQLIIIALTLIKKIDTVSNLIINPVKVSGTIKKVENYAIYRNKKLCSKTYSPTMLSEFKNISGDDAND
ncbi:HEL059Cp [Eremothecium sinecaudum]|uniref:Ribonuclease P/MRP protein subunit POP5 n=1 Tax=Eremothecium sinecaudum TaxID=45286 RepID=A0A0X8HSV0_9SACH|nr:HEL059Cp [Eremothecium sinecaudum]AMD21221.1 HEL059Cp [Eremothecium sinecaudum]